MRPKLTYANVVATLALFVAIGGAGAFAASHLGKNSVGSKQLKKNAVTTAKIKKGAVTAAKIAKETITGTQVHPASLTGADVQDGSLTGTDIDQSTLTSVRASNVTGVALNGDCTPAAPFPSGVSAETAGSSGCKVTFPSSVIDCAATATVGIRTTANVIIAEDRTVETLRNPDLPNEMRTFPSGNGTKKTEPVDLTVVC
jgi:hypothetical protein